MKDCKPTIYTAIYILMGLAFVQDPRAKATRASRMRGSDLSM